MKTPEKSRDSNIDDSLKIVSPSEEKREDINMTLCEEVYVKEVHHKCEHWQCQFNATDTTELASLIKMKHAVVESFIHPSSNEVFECPGCNYVFLADHNFDGHIYEEHFYSFDCRHCCKHLPGEDEMAGIHYKMCPAPCDGHPYIHCKLYDTLKAGLLKS